MPILKSGCDLGFFGGDHLCGLHDDVQECVVELTNAWISLGLFLWIRKRVTTHAARLEW